MSENAGSARTGFDTKRQPSAIERTTNCRRFDRLAALKIRKEVDAKEIARFAAWAIAHISLYGTPPQAPQADVKKY
jgi:hypothetical protein